MKIFIICISMFLAVNAVTEEDEAAWTDFKRQYKKVFLNKDTEDTRKEVFVDHLHKVVEHNDRFKQGLETYKTKIYETADLTNEEFQAKFTGIKRGDPVPPPSSSFVEYEPPQVRQSPPTIWDQRVNGPGTVDEVKDQGSCGSCWAFSAAESAANVYSIRYGRHISLSQQQQIDCNTGTSGCSGGWFIPAFDYIQRTGLAASSSYPYTARQGTCRDSSVSKVVRTSKLVKMSGNDNELASWIAKNGTCSVCVDAYYWNTYGSGIYTGATGSTLSCTHAVAVIGHGPGYWLIKNSWGKNWGESGYIKLSKNRNGGIIKEHIYCPVA